MIFIIFSVEMKDIHDLEGGPCTRPGISFHGVPLWLKIRGFESTDFRDPQSGSIGGGENGFVFGGPNGSVETGRGEIYRHKSAGKILW